MKKTALLLLLLLFIQCKKEKHAITETNPKFLPYIAANSSGLISTHDPIKVVLKSPYKGKVNKNEEILDDVFDFSPSVSGKTYLRNKTTLEFIPDEPLDEAEVYEVTLHLDEFIPDIEDDIEEYDFLIQTIKQDYKLFIDGVFNRRPNEPGVYFLSGHIKTSDFVSNSDVEEMLKIKFLDQQKKIFWEHDSVKLTHEFKIKDLQAQKKATHVEFFLDGDPIDVDKEQKQKFEVPALDDFKITQVTAQSNPEQLVTVNFSQPIQSEDFEGLVQIKKEGDSQDYVKSVSVQGNEMVVYTNKKIGGDFQIIFNDGITSTFGNQLGKTQKDSIVFNEIYPQVNFVGNGQWIPNKDGVYVPFEAVGLNAVDVKITKVFENNVHQFFQNNELSSTRNMKLLGRKIFYKTLSLSSQPNFDSQQSAVYQLEISKIIDAEPGAIYNIELSFKQEYANFPCGDKQPKDKNLTPLQSSEDPFYAYSDVEYDYEYYEDYYYPEDFDWEEKDNPCHVSYYTAEKNVSKNVVGSNLGMIYKEGNDRKGHIAISNILSTKPISGVKIAAYDLQNQIVGEGSTNGDGFCTFDLKRKPFLIKAKKGDEVGYLKVNDGNTLSFSSFSIDGENLQQGQSGFIYGERGVWRPGDDIFLSFVLNNSNASNKEFPPATLELSNPEGVLVEQITNNSPVGGFYTYRLKTAPDAPTGQWNARVKVGGADFYKSIRIETIKPNRLRIQTEIPNKILAPYLASNQINVKAEWLTGVTAKNLKTNITGTLFSSNTSFKGFESYEFDDEAKSINSSEFTLFEGQLNAEGKTSFKPNLSLSNAPGMLNLGIFTKVFETGGNFSTNYVKKTVSPYASYAGFLLPKRDRYSDLDTDKEYIFPVVNVNEEGKLITENQLEVSVFRLDRSWWYNANQRDIAYYINNEFEYLIHSEKITVNSGKSSFKLKIPKRDYGNYYIRVKDLKSGHTSGERVWFDWPYRPMDTSNKEAISLMQISTDKEKYKVGETASITLPKSPEGKALISLENGTGVLKKYWIDLKQGINTHQIELEEDMAPNVYVNVSLLQQHEKTVNDIPIRKYGVVNLDVENPDNVLHPILKSPEKIRPESTYSVSVSEKNGKEMTYTLAIVDEGLLGITNFKTPDIYDHFNRKQALGTKTWDIYDQVLGAYGGRIESVFTIGGDQALEASNKEKINRFKPVVTFLGPYKLEKGASKTHQLEMPNYVGSAKVMVVAGHEGAFGSTEADITVKKPLMTLITMPRELSPGDQIKIPVSVFAMENHIKNVNISFHSDLKIDQTQQTLNFTETGEKLCYFTATVPEKSGVIHVKTQATSGSESATDEFDIRIRLPNAPEVRTQYLELSAQNAQSITVNNFGIQGTNENSIQFSTLPNLNLENRINYLIRYPHGCLEQTSSAMWAQLHLANLMNLTQDEKEELDVNIKGGLKKLNQFLNPNGSLSYWPQRGGYANDWSTSYALHLMLEAEKLGYKLPPNMKKTVLHYQDQKAKQWSSGELEGHYYFKEQAYRLFTLALGKKANMAEMNKLAKKKLDAPSLHFLAAAYYLNGQKKRADELLLQSSIIEVYNYDPVTYGSDTRDQGVKLYLLSLMGKRTQAFSLLKTVASKLSKDGYYSTQSTGFALMGIYQYLDGERADQIAAKVTVNGKSYTVNSSQAVYQLPIASGSVNIQNTSNGKLFVSVVRKGVAPAKSIPTKTKNLKLNVRYVDMQGASINVANIAQGTDFKAIVEIENPGELGYYDDLALTHLFPCGWEIINTRLYEVGKSNQKVRYQDFRDDRVMSYFALPSKEKISIEILLNATYQGSYYIPAVAVESMYREDIFARWNSGKTTII